MGQAYIDPETGREYYDASLKEPIVPRITFKYPNLSGRAKRYILRNNTVHLRGQCPKCGEFGARFKHDIPLLKGGWDHNKWVCKKCGARSTREELSYVKYA